MIHNRSAVLVIALISILLTSCGSNGSGTIQTDPKMEPDGLFLFVEESPPGPEPERFGGSWFTGGFHSAPVFSPDGKTVWWAGSFASQRVYVSRFENGSWSEKEQVSFSENISSYRDPFISPDGLRFYFISTEPIPDQNSSSKENLWMMTWESGEWGEPQPLPEAVNNLSLHWTPSVAGNYDLYFSANLDGNPDIVKSAFVDGEYTEPVTLGPPISTEALEFTPNIAPDQSYLLFSRTQDNKSPAHLYISYASGDGWTEPVRVENVKDCISPIVTPDRKKVIYLNGPSELWWRDTSFIEELRPD